MVDFSKTITNNLLHIKHLSPPNIETFYLPCVLIAAMYVWDKTVTTVAGDKATNLGLYKQHYYYNHYKILVRSVAAESGIYFVQHLFRCGYYSRAATIRKRHLIDKIQ